MFGLEDNVVSRRLPVDRVRTARSTLVASHVIMMSVVWFNFLLCFLDTQNVIAVSPAYIMVIQIALLGAAGWVGAREVSPNLLFYSVVVVITIAGLKLISPDLDLKILFDLAIMPVFFNLGRRVSIDESTVLLRNILICVVLVGLIEMFFTDQYQSAINIWKFYVNKGAVEASTTNFTGTSFFTNGERSELAGRTLLPGILSNHRASSLFLEAVSMGNFPIICLAYLLSVRTDRRKLRYALYAMTFSCVVLPDSRFASACCIFVLLLWWSGFHRSLITALLLPFAACLGLWLVGSIYLAPSEVPHILSDDLGGRLLFSGKLLAYWHVSNWFAFATSPVYVLDTGYAYLLSFVGLPMACLIWTAFVCAKPGSREAEAMRGLIAVYYATSLCINSSAFSIKTAAILWFLYGAASSGRYDLQSARRPSLSPGGYRRLSSA